MRAAVIGCVDFSHAMLVHLLTIPNLEVAAVVTRQESRFNSDFRSLLPLARAHGISCLLADGCGDKEMADWLKPHSPDIIFCLGWSYLLGQDMLKVAPRGVIGYHPAPLPRGRGRHPLIWALALGLSETASCFFVMDHGADSGDIVSRQRIVISAADDASTLMSKMIVAARRQLDAIVGQLAEDTLPREPQRHNQTVSWRKRSDADGTIDWRMSASTIHNLVRALTRPYVGAHFVHAGVDVKVWRTRLRETKIIDIEPGRVLDIKGANIIVKCGDGAISLVEHDMDYLPNIGDYL